MDITKQVAKHLREVHFGGNWTWVNLKEVLGDVTLQEATAKVPSFNTIVALTYHINYFVAAILRVLRNTPIAAHDKYSFDHPPINSQEDWGKLLDKVWTEASDLAALIEQLPDSKLQETFVDEKYGNYHRNLLGVIEHTHYHMGQIVMIKKMLRANQSN